MNLFETNRVYFLIGSCSCDISITISEGKKKKVSGENIEVADGNQAGVSDELVVCPKVLDYLITSGYPRKNLRSPMRW